MSVKYKKILVLFVVGIIIWFIPHPEAIKPEAWHMFAIFVATIVGFMLQPIPVGGIAFLALTITAITGTLKITDILSGFGNTTAWLIVTAFLFARSFQKTGLGQRISFILVKNAGQSTLKLLYALLVSDLIIAPVMPSNTARAGGIFFPIVRSLATSYHSEPGESSGKIGRFLLQGMFHGDNIISGLYLTAMAGNPLMVGFIASIAGIEISWGGWLLASSVPILSALIVIPLVLYKMDPPEIKHTPEAKGWAEQELANLGQIKVSEKWLLAIFLLALVLWGTSGLTKINATTVAFVAVGCMLLTNILEWEDIIKEKNAWDVLIWMGGIMCLAGFLSKLGLVGWFADAVASQIGFLSWPVALGVVLVIYVGIHYLFASMIAHIAALFAALYAVTVVVGAPPYLAAFLMLFANTSMQGLTHYSVGGAPIYFSAGYVSQAKWWTHGFIFTILQNIIYVGAGLIWLKVLGLY